MISKHKYKNLQWVDLENPTRDEVMMLSEEYKIPELVNEELLSPSVRSKVDKHGNNIYMILHFPMLKKHTVIQEIDFFVGKDFLITAHYEHSKPLANFAKLFELHNDTLDKNNLDMHAGALLFMMLKELYANCMNELTEMETLMDNIKVNIFAEKEREMVRYISEMNHKLLDFKQAIRFHGDVLKSFEIATHGFFDKSFEYHTSVIIGEYNKVENVLESLREILVDLRETNDSLLTNKTNDTMKALTIITFIISPVTVISSLFMMNTDFVLIKTANDFYLIIAAMLLTSAITFIYFRIKKWL